MSDAMTDLIAKARSEAKFCAKEPAALLEGLADALEAAQQHVAVIFVRLSVEIPSAALAAAADDHGVLPLSCSFSHRSDQCMRRRPPVVIHSATIRTPCAHAGPA